MYNFNGESTLKKLTLRFIDADLSVCRLEPDAPIPGWALESRFYSITRTDEELSVVCDARCIPEDCTASVVSGWAMLRVEGVLDFSLTGVLSSITVPLADAGISVFALSTFDTDYLLIKKNDLELARHILGNTFDIQPRKS